LKGRRIGWAVALWFALLAGILVAWSPRYWAVSVAIAAVSLVAVLRMVLARDIRIPPHIALVASIGTFGFLQIALHTTVLAHLTLENSLVWAVSAAAFLLGADILSDRAARHIFLDLLLWSLTLLAVIAIPQHYLSPDRAFGIFVTPWGGFGTLLSPNQFAAMMELAAPIALWRTLDRNPLAGGMCFVMILAAAVSTSSRAGVTLIGVELLVFAMKVLMDRRANARLIASVAAGLVLVVGTATMIAGTETIKAKFADRGSYELRRRLLNSTLQLIAARPVTGYGLGTWRSVYPQSATFDVALIANEAHNDWAQWTCDGGIPFGLLMAALLAWSVKPAFQSVWGLGVISVMAHSYVDYPIREPILSILWFVMAGALATFDRSPEKISPRKIPEDSL
jgi:O-antigen ligase